MEARRADRIWLVGGLIAIVILIAAAWLLAISPKFAEADEVQAQADDTTIQLASLRKEVAKLKEQNEKKATYQAQLDTLVTNLPETYGMPVFLRSLQDSGAATSVEVSDLSVAAPVASDQVTTAVKLPLSMNVKGTIPNISKFIVRLQQTQNRAVLLDTVTVSAPDEDKLVVASLTLTAFCTKNNLADSTKLDRTDMCATT
ncbi:type 4a pilus biogenesis protein PilO [Paractinoplanes hotanensis]|uniref:Type 4a pilus biogenesis protein PilO n=1 Tax=Paractinoplanes hotanensis TaxID=2906497 RepID=A0ABT0Y467_9ACTN|nr:type 4a pilus biogenesis protein PilO [Actinoplanes hotanensis]MCM4080836.1 type 4a pilus biogenesis protein PilO [Actinoplanes hotanensis]